MLRIEHIEINFYQNSIQQRSVGENNLKQNQINIIVLLTVLICNLNNTTKTIFL